MRAFILWLGLSFVVLGPVISGQAQGHEPYRLSKVEGEVPDTDALFHSVEQRLLEAETIALTYRVEAHGAINVGIDGTLYLRNDQAVLFLGKGTFMTNPADLHLTSDGTQMQGGSAAGTFDTETPEALNESLIVGFMRMGILHNLARLTAGYAPDHADGGTAEWVEVRDVTTPESVILKDRPAQKMTFQIYVADQHSGEASLWVDTETGLPLQRTQVVHFEHGTMNVVEQYRTLKLDEPLDEALFAFGE